MKTMKRIGLYAACMVLLLITTTSVKADNDWFADKNNFNAYYDGMGNIYFDLLVWTEGGWNHWAYNDYSKNDDSYCTYVRYSTDGKDIKSTDKAWTNLFYYNGDNVENKKENGAVWIKPAIEKGQLTVLNSTLGLDQVVSMEKGTDNKYQVSRFSLPHNGDERRSVTVSIKWSIPQELEGKTITVQLVLRDTRHSTLSWYYKHAMMVNEQLEKGEVPELQQAILFTGSSDKDAIGMVMVPYMVSDQLVSYATSFDLTKEINNTNSFGYITLPAADSVRRNFYIKAKVRRMNDQIAEVTSNKVDILAYHNIYDFKVAPYCDPEKGGNTGNKVLTWSIHRPQEKDIVPFDFFEIQRAYKSDFTDAQTICSDKIYHKDTANYQYIDNSEGSINPDLNGAVYYRIRRMSSSDWGWNHTYVQSAVCKDTIRQIGLDLYKDKITPYVAFRDCSDDSIDIVGQIVWQNENMMRNVAWDKNVTLEICLKDEQGEIPLKTLTLDSLNYRKLNNMVMYEFAYHRALPISCQRYDLFVRMNAENTRFAKPETTEVWFYPKQRTSAINVLSVTATDGDEAHPEYTAIGWKADGQPEYFVIRRRRINDQNFDSIATVGSTQAQYLDYTAVPGDRYTYKVEAVTNCTGSPLRTYKTDIGSRSRYGYIEGYVSYTNGDKVADITVELRDVKSEAVLKTVKTTPDGKYTFSLIEYALDDKGTRYYVSVSSDDSRKFKSTAGEGPTYVTLTPSVPAARNINFVSSDYQRYSGRVLYSGTTIPVRDALFLINDKIAISGGDTVRTDGLGNFTLSVPAGPDFTLTVIKDKHTFVNDGRLIIDETDTLNAQKGSLDGIRFWDNTRTRLVGRLVGGDIQGSKPLDFGLSKNNLGDSLKLVFELEGDNIAHFVYDEKNLSKNTFDTTFVRVVGKEKLTTKVRFEEKRIIVRPDGNTGEYTVELPPVKYRIVEASANGYATLFSAGRTSETKDLTYSLTPVTAFYGNEQTQYHDTYSVIYHAPASVAVTQLRFGVPMEHYGEEMVEGYTLDTTRMDVVCKKINNQWEYLFGYPVYISGLQYGFRINAREEYRYNNDRNSAPDLVPLGNHKYTIYNGLNSGTSTLGGKLDSLGNADILLEVKNLSFDGVGEQALKHFDVSVNINGQDVHAEPVKAFVTGSALPVRTRCSKLVPKSPCKMYCVTRPAHPLTLGWIRV